MIIEARPWFDGQTLTHSNGLSFVATGAGSYKMAAPDAPVEPPADLPKQEIFCAGETLPAWTVGRVDVCLKDGSIVDLADGEAIPSNIDGNVFVDEANGKPVFNQNPVKKSSAVLVNQFSEPTQEQCDSGVQFWFNLNDECLYTKQEDGSWYSSDKGDTDTFTTIFQATSGGLDDIGGSFGASDWLYLLADGTVVCASKTQPSTATSSADGLSSVIKTSDGGETQVCLKPVKDLRDNGDNSFTVLYAGGEEGGTYSFGVDTDQKLTNPTITQETVGGVTTHTITWDVADIDGNVIGQESATGISMPTFMDKSGNPIAGAVTVMQQSDFIAAGVVDPDTDKIFGTRNGECAEFDAPANADCVLTVNGASPEEDGNVNTTGDVVEDQGDLTYLVTPSDGSDAFVIDTRCKKYIEYAIDTCPVDYPACLKTDSGNVEITNSASLQSYLDDTYGTGVMVFNESDCTIKGCVLADSDFGIDIGPGLESITLSVAAGTPVINSIITNDGSDYTVLWPNGQLDTVASGASQSGGAQSAGDVVISFSGVCSCIEYIKLAGSWNFDISALTPTGSCLKTLIAGFGNSVTGSIETLFASTPILEEFNINLGSNTTTGDLAVAFSNTPLLKKYINQGQNTSSGDIAVAFSSTPDLVAYNNQGQNTTSGDLVAAFSNTPDLGNYTNLGSNTTSGDLVAAFASTPILLTYINEGLNTTSGDIAAAFASTPLLTSYKNTGDNTTSGDIVSAFASTPVLGNYTNEGDNTTSGDVALAFASTPNLNTYVNTGLNNTSGDIAVAFANTPLMLTYTNAGLNNTSGDIAVAFAGTPLMVSYTNEGSNTTSGDLTAAIVSGLPPLKVYKNTGANTVIATGSIGFAPTMRVFQQWGVANTQSEVDFMLASLVSTSWVIEKLVDVKSVNSSPSSTGLADAATVTANGATVITN